MEVSPKTLPKHVHFPRCLWIFLCGCGCLGSPFIDEAGLELTEILLPRAPECWD
ncbi:rCG53866 [Rattus norvegicus]|uniref:RCG53866 n=1 Tax=Rattus norvegicus TaxID=10116 RepID=A6J990_RAT|nr:rCG53866 [Rattus norvegicus]